MVLPGQTFVIPPGEDMAPGCAGGVAILTASVRADPDPHALFAITEIIPPALPLITVINLVEEVPDHPDGSCQVYDVAPGTLSTEYT